MSRDLRLRHGVSASGAISALDNLVVQATLGHSGGGTDILALQNNYLAWVETAERSLGSYFASSWTWEELDR